MVIDDFRLEALGMLLHALHQRRPRQAMYITGPVIHLSGGGQLAAGLQAGDQQGLEIRTRSINRRTVAGRAGAQNDHAGMTISRHQQLLPALPAAIKRDFREDLGEGNKVESPTKGCCAAYACPTHCGNMLCQYCA